MTRVYPQKTNPTSPSLHHTSWFVLVLVATATFTGCQSGNFRAKKLPNEFRAVATTGGRAIDFSRVSAPGVSDSLIARGDLLEITVTNGREEELNKLFLVRVDADGVATVPVVGRVRVAGREEFEASHEIARQSVQRGIYLHPTVAVEIKKKAMNRITMVGAVEKPGIIELPRNNSSIASAVALAEGFTKEAGTEVEVIRQPKYFYAANSNGGLSPELENSGEVQLASYEGVDGPAGATGSLQRSDGMSAPQSILIDLASKESLSGDFRLQDRDVVRVLPRKNERIFVTGLVVKSGQFLLPKEQDVHLLDAISMAGGTSSLVADKVLVIRRVPDREEPIVIRASIREAKQNGLENLRLTAGDTITVEQTPATAVVDTAEKFFRFSLGIASSSVF